MTPRRAFRLPDWEICLVERFLKIGENGDSSPIRSFEVSPETLADAGQFTEPNEAESSFRDAVLSDQYLWRALRDGEGRRPTQTAPNCFTILAMTLLIDSLLDGEIAKEGEFRRKMASWLKVDRRITELSGIATMWRRLAGWLNEKVSSGEPFRQLILPCPGGWRQIGHTKRLSFPTKSDVGYLRRVLDKFGSGLGNQPALVRYVETALTVKPASPALAEAFEEFKAAFRSNSASTDHRFWKLLVRADQARQDYIRSDVELTLSYDEDNETRVSVLSGREKGYVEFPDVGAALRSSDIQNSGNLAAAVSRGVVFFRQIGVGNWLACAEPAEGARSTLVAVREHWRNIGMPLVRADNRGDWHLTKDPVGWVVVDDLLRQMFPGRDDHQRVAELALVGGVRMGAHWLGRPDFLPRVEAGEWKVTIDKVDERASADISIEDDALVTKVAVEGAFEIGARSPSGDSEEWRRRLMFVANAPPHKELNGAIYKENESREWISSGNTAISEPTVTELQWDQTPSPVDDLLEALYASSRSGIQEPEFIELIRRGARWRHCAWDVARALQEATVVEARLRSKWRGRIWSLGRPTLHIAAPNFVIVEGAIPFRLEQEFREVAANIGGKPFRRVTMNVAAPAVIGAGDADPQELARRLGWAINRDPTQRFSFRGDLETTTLLGEHHVVASHWDWQKRRFVQGSGAAGPITLSRMVHQARADHDIYRIDTETRRISHLTRSAAILNAHRLARLALFEEQNGFAVRAGSEGYLPLEIAIYLRRQTLTGSGPLTAGGYAYSFGRDASRNVAAALPGCLKASNSDFSLIEGIVAARRSGGKKRVVLGNGGIGVEP